MAKTHKLSAQLTIHNRIDPPTCGCTDCLVGWSVPLESANWLEVKRMLKGKIVDATSHRFEIVRTSTSGQKGAHIEVRSIYNANLRWDWYKR